MDKAKLTLEAFNESITIEFPEDSIIDSYFRAFRVALLNVEFVEGSIRDGAIRLAEDIKEESRLVGGEHV